MLSLGDELFVVLPEALKVLSPEALQSRDELVRHERTSSDRACVGERLTVLRRVSSAERRWPWSPNRLKAQRSRGGVSIVIATTMNTAAA